MTWAASLFFGFACFCVLVCVISSLSIRRPIPASIIPLFIFALLTTEFAWFFLGLQVLISLVFVALGALDETGGVVALGLMVMSWIGLWRLHGLSHKADEVMRESLRSGLGTDFRGEIPLERQAVLREHILPSEWMRPISMRRHGVERLDDFAYGEAGERNLLDIYRPVQAREGGFPVLLQVHGGGWYSGHKAQQAQPLLNHLAQRGWLCVSINYRLSPRDKFPAHIIDVKKAIHWIRQHIAEYGSNADFLAITGGSAGGHLAALAALSINDPTYQPGFEDADTHIDAAVPLYGVYDFLDRDGQDLNAALRGFLEEKIMPGSAQEAPELWDRASPITRIHNGAPPFFIIHGDTDVMTSWEVARQFYEQMEAVSDNPVAHAELPGCQHAFDGVHSVRSNYLLNHITDFLEWAHAPDLASKEAASV